MIFLFIFVFISVEKKSFFGEIMKRLSVTVLAVSIVCINLLGGKNSDEKTTKDCIISLILEDHALRSVKKSLLTKYDSPLAKLFDENSGFEPEMIDNRYYVPILSVHFDKITHWLQYNGSYSCNNIDLSFELYDVVEQWLYEMKGPVYNRVKELAKGKYNLWVENNYFSVCPKNITRYGDVYSRELVINNKKGTHRRLFVIHGQKRIKIGSDGMAPEVIQSIFDDYQTRIKHKNIVYAWVCGEGFCLFNCDSARKIGNSVGSSYYDSPTDLPYIDAAYGDYICLPTKGCGKKYDVYQISTSKRKTFKEYEDLNECSIIIKPRFHSHDSSEL